VFGFSRKKHGRELVPNLYYFKESPMLDCCMYILKAPNDDLLLVDAGNGKSLDSLITAMENFNLDFKKITKVLITHEHLDHVLGIYPLIEMLVDNPPEIIAPSITAKILQDGDENQICPGSLGISAAQFGVEIVPLKVTSLKEGESLDFGDFHFQVFDTPGHSLGSATYYDPQNKIIFPGDVVFPMGSFGRYDFPGGSLSTLKKSIERLSKLDVEYLCSGHMDAVKNGTQQILKSLKNISYL
jgi:hydroxyacylglutathione hydrolase